MNKYKNKFGQYVCEGDIIVYVVRNSYENSYKKGVIKSMKPKKGWDENTTRSLNHYKATVIDSVSNALVTLTRLDKVIVISRVSVMHTFSMPLSDENVKLIQSSINITTEKENVEK